MVSHRHGHRNHNPYSVHAERGRRLRTPGIAFDVAFLALIVNCFVFVRRFVILRHRGWAAYCAAIGVVLPTLIVLGFANMAIIGLLFLAAGAIAMAWLASVAANLLSSDMKGSREQMSA